MDSVHINTLEIMEPKLIRVRVLCGYADICLPENSFWVMINTEVHRCINDVLRQAVNKIISAGIKIRKRQRKTARLCLDGGWLPTDESVQILHDGDEVSIHFGTRVVSGIVDKTCDEDGQLSEGSVARVRKSHHFRRDSESGSTGHTTCSGKRRAEATEMREGESKWRTPKDLTSIGKMSSKAESIQPQAKKRRRSKTDDRAKKLDAQSGRSIASTMDIDTANGKHRTSSKKSKKRKKVERKQKLSVPADAPFVNSTDLHTEKTMIVPSKITAKKGTNSDRTHMLPADTPSVNGRAETKKKEKNKGPTKKTADTQVNSTAQADSCTGLSSEGSFAKARRDMNEDGSTENIDINQSEKSNMHAPNDSDTANLSRSVRKRVRRRRKGKSTADSQRNFSAANREQCFNRNSSYIPAFEIANNFGRNKRIVFDDENDDDEKGGGDGGFEATTVGVMQPPPPPQMTSPVATPKTLQGHDTTSCQQPETFVDRDYEALTPLLSFPRVGDFIAFKMLEVGESMTPEVSSYKEALVVNVDHGMQRIQLKPVRGVLEDPLEGTGDGSVWIPFKHLLNPRLIPEAEARGTCHGKANVAPHCTAHGTDQDEMANNNAIEKDQEANHDGSAKDIKLKQPDQFKEHKQNRSYSPFLLLCENIAESRV
ncbi:PREDICTED: coilin-like [Priapulus caudatus]|uniref:Coilin-like n=1 Tax=Priapulus caudatus TaxID=37621 RepID=A0ABM1EY12_PRICU|nr:PREDICTED: coilin-like [Priapulus caudatus]